MARDYTHPLTKSNKTLGGTLYTYKGVIVAVKKVVRVKKVSTVKDESFTELDMYCIWLDEFYRSLRKAGLPEDVCMGLITDKNSYPDWIRYGKSTEALVAKALEDEDDA